MMLEITKVRPSDAGIWSNFAGLRISSPIMNAAGTCTSLEGVEILARSYSAAIVVGSITVEGREWNYADWQDTVTGTIYHSLALPNGGQHYFRKYLPEMAIIAHDCGKPLVVSIAGFCIEEYRQLAVLAVEGGADIVELNLGCGATLRCSPNSSIFSYDEHLVGETLYQLGRECGDGLRVVVKVSTVLDPAMLVSMVGVIAQYRIVKAVATTNVSKKAFSYPSTNRVSCNDVRGFYGFEESGAKHFGLQQVRQLRSTLPATIQLAGVGGVKSASDVQDYLNAGASVVQIGRAYAWDGPQIFERLRFGSVRPDNVRSPAIA